MKTCARWYPVRAERLPASILIAALIMLCAPAAFAAKNSTDYYNEGMGYVSQGDYGKAEESFKKAIEVNEWYCLGHYGLGRVYMYKKETMGTAIIQLQRCVELDPDFASGWFYLGMAQLFSEKYVDALHSFDNAYKKNRKYIEALYNMATIYEHLGDGYKAFFYYRKYIEAIEEDRKKINR